MPANTITENQIEIATILNNNFVQCAEKLKNLLPQLAEPLQQFDDFPQMKVTIFLHPTNNEEVENPIQSFANKNNTIEDFPFHILKFLAVHISPNCSKTARVTPLFKKGDPLDPSNYRPISVVLSINKIFEHILFSRLDSFITQSHNIISNRQYSFSSNKSINDALYDLLGTIRTSLNHEHCCITVFCDHSKAFDMVDHDKLLMKLSRIGIRGITLSILNQFLYTIFPLIFYHFSMKFLKDPS